MELCTSQLLAIEHIKEYAKTRKEKALKTIKEILKMSNLTFEDFELALSQIRLKARVALHFHPDRLDSKMKSVAENLLEEGIYKSQFETLISNGSVSAYLGGARDLWEKNLFGGAYNIDSSNNSQRPKYGALDLMLHPDGSAPRFGSCYFLLKPSVSQRSTFTYLDSHQEPLEKGTLAEFDDILSALLTEVFTRDYALGTKNLTVPKLIQHLSNNLSQLYENPANKPLSNNLNHYIEAQIHGEINLKTDIEKIVVDPSFKNTYIEDIFQKIVKKYDIELYYHSGFTLAVKDVPSDFRGSTMPLLAKRITNKAYLNPYLIGLASLDLKKVPKQWSEFGNYEEVLQELKLLWQVLVKYGKSYKLNRKNISYDSTSEK